MTKRFSSRELFEVRNYIPVDMLIKDELLIPSKIRDGVFRFLCPICNEFRTATKPTTNLARCFSCERNFNTIDLVIRVRGSGFRESVLFLQHLLGKIPNKNEDARQALNKLVSGIGQPMPEGLN
jgi:hypothetical protein